MNRYEREYKELLLKDLCARLPYGVKFMCNKNIYTTKGLDLIVTDEGDWEYAVTAKDTAPIEIDFIKPYLFPLSSMTDEQAKEIQQIIGNPDYACIIRKTDGLELWLNFIDTDPTIWLDAIFEVQDYLNKNYFDYRNLINKNLAIDCTNLNIY